MLRFDVQNRLNRPGDLLRDRIVGSRFRASASFGFLFLFARPPRSTEHNWNLGQTSGGASAQDLRVQYVCEVAVFSFSLVLYSFSFSKYARLDATLS